MYDMQFMENSEDFYHGKIVKENDNEIWKNSL